MGMTGDVRLERASGAKLVSMGLILNLNRQHTLVAGPRHLLKSLFYMTGGFAVYFAIASFCLLAALSCKFPSPNLDANAGSQPHASSVEDSKGDEDRCGLEDGIYQDVYRVLQPALATIVDLYDETEGQLKPEVTDPTAKLIVVRTRQWLLNLMGMKERPIHPIAFFAVIKDFETAKTNILERW